MRKRETAEIAMYANVADFLTKNKAEFTDYNRLNIEITTFTGLQLMLTPLLAKHAAIITGITADKNTAFDKLGKLVLKVARITLVFAKDNNNHIKY